MYIFETESLRGVNCEFAVCVASATSFYSQKIFARLGFEVNAFIILTLINYCTVILTSKNCFNHRFWRRLRSRTTRSTGRSSSPSTALTRSPNSWPRGCEETESVLAIGRARKQENASLRRGNDPVRPEAIRPLLIGPSLYSLFTTLHLHRK